MRAATFREPGDPARVLTVQDVLSPEPATGEVLVDVDASVIQPADLMFIRGNYRIRPTLPQVAGVEGTGTIVATGAGVAIAPGTRVAFRHPGAWAERVAVPAERCYVVPDGVAIDTAASDVDRRAVNGAAVADSRARLDRARRAAARSVAVRPRRASRAPVVEQHTEPPLQSAARLSP
jgi:D-arabinose 1-dehydrogenase-like Zn-dependent alcohol dehydrogenase